MLPILKSIKESIERVTGCRVYRNTLPHGIDCYLDIEKLLGRKSIKVVFDVGANVGQSALNYLHQFPCAKIYSFEPVSATYQQLVASTQTFTRISPYKLGMAREPGRTIINVNPASSCISSIKLRRPEDHSETIDLESIASFTEKHQLETIDFLKVDTEGYDLEVLAGAAALLQRQKIHFVLSECEPVVRTRNFVSFPALAEFLGGFGYRLFGVYDQQSDTDGTLHYWNVLFSCGELVDQAHSRDNQ